MVNGFSREGKNIPSRMLKLALLSQQYQKKQQQELAHLPIGHVLLVDSQPQSPLPALKCVGDPAPHLSHSSSVDLAERTSVVVEFSCELEQQIMEMIEVKGPKSAETLCLNTFWLRDHCRCEKCYNVVTKQRKFSLLDLPDDVHPTEAFNSDDGESFVVKWSDGHESTYSFDFLYSSQLATYMKSKDSSAKIPWNAETIFKSKYAKVKLSDLVKEEKEVWKVVNSLWRYGVALIEEVPPNQTMTEMAIRRVFPVMKTFFGEMYTFTDAQDHADTAYSKEYIGSHTDNTYFCDASGLQVLHCIQHEGTGGENFFVDGLKVAKELQQINPKAFETLTKVLVPAEYIEDGEFHVHYGPVIRTNPVTGEVVQLRLNIYDRAALNTLPQTEMKEFYDSFKAFLKLVESQENRWTLKLNPGTVVIFDNWRVFHARHAYTGVRKMSGCYVQRTDYLSKARILGIIE